MAQKLSVVIALEGAEEIKDQLADLGKTGADAFKAIKAEADKVGGFDKLDPTEVEQKLKDLGVTGVQAIDDIQDAVERAGNLETIVEGVRQLENSFGALGKVIRPLGGEFRRITATASALYKAVGPIGLAVAGSFVAAAVAITAANKLTTDFAQSITKISAEAIKLGVSFQTFDAARKRLEKLGISADAISAGFEHVRQQAERMRLEQVGRDAEAVRQGFSGSGAALERLKRTAQEFTAVGDAAAEALRSLGMKIPGVSEANIQKYGIELAKLIALFERLTGQKVDIDFSADPVQQLKEMEELIRLMPESVERTAAALRYLGPALGTQVLQDLRLMEGSLPPIEANALRLTMAINQMMAAWARFGSVTFAPFVTAQINAVTGAVNALQNLLDNFTWETFATAYFKAAEALKYFNIQGMISLGIKWAWDLSGFDSLIDKLAKATQSLLEWLGLAAQAGGTPLAAGGAPIGGPGGGIGGAARGGSGGRGTGTSDSNLAWLSRGEYIMPARAVQQPGVLAYLEALRRSGGIPRFAEGGLAGGAGSIIGSIIDGIVQTVNQIREVMIQTDTAMAGIQRSIIDQLRALSRVAGGVRDITRNARGGLLGGRGTGTSDSNLAWVSRGEHIMPARAVRQPGVLAFLEALRHSGGDLSRILDGMGRFALGGMVPRAIPAFATGGLAGGNHVTIQFPGLPEIGGLRASSSAVGELRKAAALAQVRSGGRKPSRYS